MLTMLGHDVHAGGLHDYAIKTLGEIKNYHIVMLEQACIDKFPG